MGWPKGTSGPRSMAKTTLSPITNVAEPQVPFDHSMGDETVIAALRDVFVGPASMAAIGNRLPQTGLDVDVGVDEGLEMAEAVAVIVCDGTPPCVSVVEMNAMSDEVSQGSSVKSTDAVGEDVVDADAEIEPVELGAAPDDSE